MVKRIYDNIKEYRKRRGWTQEDLARKVGYSDKAMISQIEKGKVDLPLSKVEKFAEVFGVRPSVLMGWSEESPAEKNGDIIEKYKSLDHKDREVVDWLLNRSE